MIKKTYYYISNHIPSIFELSRSSVAKNAAALYAIQFAQYILPLATVPYLLRIIGPSGFGIVSLVNGAIAYFSVFIDYGFSLSATRAISINRKNKLEVNRIFINTIAAKLFLFFLGLLVLIPIIIFIPELRQNYILAIIAYIGIIGNIIFPIWLFQGMEQMSFLAASNLLTQILMAAGIFIFVKNPHDLISYMILIAGTQILNGIITTIKGIKMFKISILSPSTKGVISALKDGWTLFLSNASLSLYTAGNPFILSLFSNSTQVGYYAAAEKLIRASQGIIVPISQAVYPKFSKLAIDSKELFFFWAKKVLIIMGIIGLSISLVMFIFSGSIVKILLGKDFGHTTHLIQILSIIPLLISITNVLGVQIMLPLNKDKSFTWILFIAGIINFVTVFCLAHRLGASASALALVLAEAFTAVAMFIYVVVHIKTSKKI